MVTLSCAEKTQNFKSRLRTIAGNLFKSRENKAAKCRRLVEENQQAQKKLDAQQKEIQQLQEELSQAKRDRELAEIQKSELAQSLSPWLLDDARIPNHHYTVSIVLLAVTLAKKLGCRPAEQAMKIFFQWLGHEQEVPSHECIRNWMQRIGLAELSEPIKRQDNHLIWMVDHTVQIGTEKVLTILGIPANEMPEPGQAIRHEDMQVLALEPGTKAAADNVETVYRQCVAKYGVPREIVLDGASELINAAEALKKEHPDVKVQRDFKHYAANRFKAQIGESERFQHFTAQMGQTRSQVQQTEMGHLHPPTQKTKARFMNLKATFTWGLMILWLLRNPQATARAGISDERFEEKFNWVREYTDDLEMWRECQEVISTSLTFMNNYGLTSTSGAQLEDLIQELSLTFEESQKLACQLIEFVKESGKHLKEGERLTISTEILESSFGLFKQLSGQHAKGGFTSLVPAFGALLCPITPERILSAFERVKNKDVKAWVKDKFKTTFAARRRAAYNHELATDSG